MTAVEQIRANRDAMVFAVTEAGGQFLSGGKVRCFNKDALGSKSEDVPVRTLVPIGQVGNVKETSLANRCC